MLTDACELEHGIACSYLYAAFSLKKQAFDAGLTSEQLRLTRFWASQIFFVAAEEMLHLAQAWNLLTAIGGTPYCLRPNLPRESRYYPIRAQISLEPFGVRALKRFITYETPSGVSTGWAARSARLSPAEVARGHVTIGQFYAAIAEGFASIDNLFVGTPANQVGSALVMFPEIVAVCDRQSALRAISMITHQGEGVATDHVDCHYGVFRGMLRALEQLQGEAGDGFSAARPVMSNPVAHSRNGYGAPAHPIRDAVTRRAAELFDAVYVLMLQALALAFTPSAHPQASRCAASAAIGLMGAVVRPLGEVLTTLPSGVDGATAGPAFGLVRFLALPQEGELAVRLILEQLEEIAQEAEALHGLRPRNGEFAVSAARCRDIAAQIAHCTEPASSVPPGVR